MATTTQVEKSEQEAMEAYQEATAMMWEMAKNNPLIDALMREDQEEVDRLMDQTMVEVREELEEIMSVEEEDEKRNQWEGVWCLKIDLIERLFFLREVLVIDGFLVVLKKTI